jgi:hypothetical protein
VKLWRDHDTPFHKYKDLTNDMLEAIEELEDLDKLGQGLSSVDLLEEVDIGDDSISRPTFVKQRLKANYKAKLFELFKDYVDCFGWNYNEMCRRPVPWAAGYGPRNLDIG